MEHFSSHGTIADLAGILAEAKVIDPNIIMIFTSSSVMTGDELKQAIADCGDAHVIGCSTSGEIFADGVGEDSVSVIAMHFDQTEVGYASANMTSSDHSFDAGVAIANQLNKDGLKAVFSLCPGVNVNGSQYVKGLMSKLDKHVVISGGLAGDGTDFSQTYTLGGGDVSPDMVVAFGLYGDHVSVTTGSKGGWSPFGPSRRVTRSEGNVLYELDGKPALELYKQYLGDKASELPSSGLLYPFAILREDRSTTGLIRTILDVDHDNESLILAGDLPQGSLVCLMHADTDSLVQGSGDAAKEAHEMRPESAKSAAILVSCVGRKLVMGDDVDEEVEAVRDILGDDIPLAGFYSYGEICPFSETDMPELHNQTMTITYISEKSVA